MPLDLDHSAGGGARGAAEIVKSACPHDCPSTCALEVERLAPDRIGRVHGAAHNPYTAGVVCAKVARYAERVHHPGRLAQPLRRVGEKGVGRAAFQEIAWDDALDAVAEGLLRAEQRHGAEAVWPYFYAGTMGLVQRDGINRLRNCKGYARQHSTICVTLADSGWKAAVGQKRGVDAREIAQSDLVVVWGGNPVSTQVNVMTHIAKARKQRGAKLVVVDPYETPTAKQADLHLALQPGTDGALAAAVVNVLLTEGYADRAYMAAFSDWDAELEAHYGACTPDWAAAITGLPAAEIVAFARLYGAHKRAFIRVGYGFSRARNGAAAVQAVACLPTVTGAWRHEGGGALYGQTELYPIDRSLIEGLDRYDRTVRALDQSRLGPILTGDQRDLGAGPPVDALFVQNTNPAVVCPDSAKVLAGLARDDLFLAVHEQFMTETAAMADIVLPATTFLEHADIYIASGHTYLQVTKPVIAPFAESRSNHQVLAGLAARLGIAHRGFELSDWEMVEETLRLSGLPDAERLYEAGGLDVALDFEAMHFLKGFPTADGRFRFKGDWRAVGKRGGEMPRLPGQFDLMDRRDADHPFRLVTAPARNYLNTSFTETPTSIAKERRPRAKIHPAAAADLGVADGGRVRLGNRQGSLLIEAEIFSGLQRDVVVVESVWPNSAFIEGIGINLLTSADAGPPKGGAVFHDTAIWVRPE